MPLHHAAVSEPSLGSTSSSDSITIGEAQVPSTMAHELCPPLMEMVEEKDKAIMISPKEIKLPEQRGTEMTRDFQCKHNHSMISS